MKQFFIILIFNVLTLNFIANPFHITITNIELNPSKACFEVCIKIFTDDLELAISQQLKENIGLINNQPASNIAELFLQYIHNEFKIFVNSKEIQKSKVKFIKYKVIDNATWLYFEFKIPSKIKQISIYNNLLNQIYPDMNNLVIIKWQQNEHGLTFTKNKVYQNVI